MAEMTSASIDNLPDSDFAYIEPGGTKDSGGKTVPRSLRHFPIQDEAHVRNALARLPQSQFEKQARPKVEAAAKRMGIGEPAGKSTGELKAEPMNTSQLDRWLKGLIPRRILVLPFGGPIPKAGAPLGTDLDGEWFDADTDLTHGHKALIESRERLVDWHHRQDPTGLMKGAILGHVLMDSEPEDEGVWADFWANAGEKRRDLIARLERGGVPLYGSSEAAYKKASDTGHIDVWPLIRHTITTSPQNTYAVLPPLKAFLTAPNIDEMPAEALKALLLGLDADTTELLLSSPSAAVTASALAGDGAVKSGRVLSKKTMNDLMAAIEMLSELHARGLLLPEEGDVSD